MESEDSQWLEGCSASALSAAAPSKPMRQPSVFSYPSSSYDSFHLRTATTSFAPLSLDDWWQYFATSATAQLSEPLLNTFLFASVVAQRDELCSRVLQFVLAQTTPVRLFPSTLQGLKDVRDRLALREVDIHAPDTANADANLRVALARALRRIRLLP